MCQSALRVSAVARKSHAPRCGRRIEKFRAALWAAGIRTHMLVCVGACLFMIVSAYGFAPVLGPNVVLDPSRVAAQVVSGIGFLGAGAILARGEIIKGLTTAASNWHGCSYWPRCRRRSLLRGRRIYSRHSRHPRRREAAGTDVSRSESKAVGS